MSNTWFRFKQFTIQQKHPAMKVGTDGVLLGAWSSLPGPGGRALDVGTGTGLIALMITQRQTDARVDALEMDAASARQARENFRNSPWGDRLHCIPASFQEYAAQSKNLYDRIICNPPFFSASFKAPSRERTLARHDDSLSLDELFQGCMLLMKKSAGISLILPAEKEAQAIDLSSQHRMHCHRLTRVKPAPGKPCKRVLLEFSFLPGECEENDLAIETGSRHVYTEEFKQLVADFYL